MEKSQKIGAQVYAYTICLVAVITFLISVTNLVNAIIDIRDPLYSGSNFGGTPNIASYDIYKMDILKSLPKLEESKGINFATDERTLKAMYDAEKAHKVQSVIHNSQRAITIGILLILIASMLFIGHWRWIQKINRQL